MKKEYIFIFIAGLFLGVLNVEKPFIGPPPAYVIDYCPEYLKPKCRGPLSDPIGGLSSLVAPLLESLDGLRRTHAPELHPDRMRPIRLDGPPPGAAQLPAGHPQVGGAGHAPGMHEAPPVEEAPSE